MREINQTNSADLQVVQMRPCKLLSSLVVPMDTGCKVTTNTLIFIRKQSRLRRVSEQSQRPYSYYTL